MSRCTRFIGEVGSIGVVTPPPPVASDARSTLLSIPKRISTTLPLTSRLSRLPSTRNFASTELDTPLG